MNRIISKIGNVLQLVLSAPIKLPTKALNMVRYVALGLGIIESVLNDKDDGRTAGKKADHENQLDETSQSTAEAIRRKSEKEDRLQQKGAGDET